MSKAKDESEEMENQIAKQREGRRPARRVDAADRESPTRSDARARARWKRPRRPETRSALEPSQMALNARRAAVHLANANNDRWVDADALFAYYNDAYFEGRLSR